MDAEMKRIKEIQDLLAKKADLTDEQIAELRTELDSLYAEIRSGEMGEDDIAGLRIIAKELLPELEAEETLRAEALANLEAELAELDATMVKPDEEDDDVTTEPELVAETPAVTPEVEPEPEVAAEPELVTASAREIPLSQLAAKASRPRVSVRENTGPRLIAAADVNRPMGSQFENRQQLVAAFNDMLSASQGGGGAGEVKMKVASLMGNFGARDTKGTDGDQFLSAISGELDSITAAGGVCGPTEAYYGSPVLGVDDRPILGALPSFKARRGKITYMPPLTLANIGVDAASPGGAVGLYTIANDAASASKTYQEIDCGTPVFAEVQAITKRLRFGNFNAMTSPERTDEIINLTDTAWAREAEQALLTGLLAGSTKVTATQDSGASRDFVRYMLQLKANLDYRHRLGSSHGYTVLAPSWFALAIDADIVMGAYTRFTSVADLVSYMASEGVRITWTYDDDKARAINGYPFQAETANSVLDAFPATAEWLMFPDGTWTALDSGQLDLGVVRDSTLNAINKYELFFESWEGVAKMGAESVRVRQAFCANGVSTFDNTAAADICDGGS